MKPDYIFIVGCFRSGTSLAVNILNASGQVCISLSETKYVGQLFRPAFRHQMRRIGDLSQDSNGHKLVEYIYSNNHGGYWKWLQTHIDREYFLRRILASDRSDRAIFTVLMEVYAQACGNEKAILGEKSPGHIYHVPTLLEWYPQAKIIHMLRDPRAVYVSQRNRRGIKEKEFKNFPLNLLNPLLALYVLLHVTVAWFRATNLHFKYKRLYPTNYYLLKYEDLISDPEKYVKQLCDFLDIEFRQEMLEQSVINSSFTSGYVGKAGFNKQAINHWKKSIRSWSNEWFILLGKKRLKEFGYIR